MPIVLISPAKTLDETPIASKSALSRVTAPRLRSRTATLLAIAAKLSSAQLRSLMSISAPLADLNRSRYAAFETQPEKACAFAFVAQFYPMYLKKKDDGKYDVKFHEDPFLQQLTFLCVCGYVITNSILTAFVLFCERGVLFWGEYYEEEDEEEGEGKGKDDAKKKKSSDNSTDAKLVGHKVCARIHHMRFSPNLTLELVSRELLSNGVVKKMDKEKKVKTKDGKVILPTCSGRVMKVVNVAEYVYTDGVFAESSYLDMVEQFVIEYEQSLEKKDK